MDSLTHLIRYLEENKGFIPDLGDHASLLDEIVQNMHVFIGEGEFKEYREVLLGSPSQVIGGTDIVAILGEEVYGIQAKNNFGNKAKNNRNVLRAQLVKDCAFYYENFGVMITGIWILAHFKGTIEFQSYKPEEMAKFTYGNRNELGWMA